MRWEEVIQDSEPGVSAGWLELREVYWHEVMK